LIAAAPGCGPGAEEFEAANRIPLPEPPRSLDPGGWDGLVALPGSISGAKEAEASLRIGPPYSSAQRAEAVRANAAFFEALARAAAAPAAVPKAEEFAAGASTRDFAVVGLLAAWKAEQTGSIDPALDALEAAAKFLNGGALVHANAASQIAQAIWSQGSLPRAADPKAISRLKDLRRAHPNLSQVMEMEGYAKLYKFATMTGDMAEQAAKTPPSDPDQRTYFLQPKKPIYDAWAGYLAEWPKAAETPPAQMTLPQLPDLIASGAFADEAFDPETVRSQIAMELHWIALVEALLALHGEPAADPWTGQPLMPAGGRVRLAGNDCEYGADPLAAGIAPKRVSDPARAHDLVMRLN
jgi:hypothetical protein